MAFTTSSTDDMELAYDYRIRVRKTVDNPRQLSAQEKQQERSRFTSRRAPKCQTGGGAHHRRNKRHGM